MNIIELLTLVISAVSVTLTFVIGALTIWTNVRISKINNIKEYKENNKHITPFELQFRNEDWLYDIIITKDEFYKYDESSQKRIIKWFVKYAETHELKKLLPTSVEIKAEETKPEEPKEDTQEDTTIKPVTVQIGARQVELANPELINVLLSRAAAPDIDIRPGVKLPKSTKSNLRDYPIGSSTITRTPIITDLEDEFDIEEDK